jgi:hypothetical protein
VLAVGNSILDRQNQRFMLDIGADYTGEANFKKDYTVVGESLSNDLVTAPFLNYYSALRIDPQDGAVVLAGIREPYFNRTFSHFSSHKNTPYRLVKAPHPAVVRYGDIIYFAHDIGKVYFEYGARVHRQLFFNALELIREKPMVEVDMPSAGRINLLHQPEKNRYLLHLLYGPPLQRGIARVIEDLVPLYNVEVRLRLPVELKNVYQIPSMETLDALEGKGYKKILVPSLQCHLGLVLEY